MLSSDDRLKFCHPHVCALGNIRRLTGQGWKKFDIGGAKSLFVLKFIGGAAHPTHILLMGQPPRLPNSFRRHGEHIACSIVLLRLDYCNSVLNRVTDHAEIVRLSHLAYSGSRTLWLRDTPIWLLHWLPIRPYIQHIKNITSASTLICPLTQLFTLQNWFHRFSCL